MTVFTPTKPTVSHFYKYKSAENLEWLKPLVLSHEIYIPSVAQLNDPIDCRPKITPMSDEEMVTFLRNDFIRRNPVLALDLLQQHEQKIRSSIQKLGLEWFNSELSKILNTHMEKYRIYSLTKRFDNFGLWAKYAADHTGYCLEFVNEGPLFDNTCEVFYGEYQPFNLNDPENRNALFLVCKRPDWSNEEEVRLILPSGKGSIVKIDPRWLARIILGMKMSAKNEAKIREWAAEREPRLIVVRAYLDELNQQIRLEQHPGRVAAP
jgi:hypothetical protein